MDELGLLMAESTPTVRLALALLHRAHEMALWHRASTWQYATEIRTLRALGLAEIDLRSLISHRLVEQRVETTGLTSRRRTFRRVKNLALFARGCFVLTKRGMRLASQSQAFGQGVIERRRTPSTCAHMAAPEWDFTMRILSVGSNVVKVFRRAAPNQELILTAFQEQEWAVRIDDPLPRRPGVDARIRLHDTIKNLNRGHLHPSLRFRGDGSGRGICWEPWQPS
jgi:hypothetical protein